MDCKDSALPDTFYAPDQPQVPKHRTRQKHLPRIVQIRGGSDPGGESDHNKNLQSAQDPASDHLKSIF